MLKIFMDNDEYTLLTDLLSYNTDAHNFYSEKIASLNDSRYLLQASEEDIQDLIAYIRDAIDILTPDYEEPLGEIFADSCEALCDLLCLSLIKGEKNAEKDI